MVTGARKPDTTAGQQTSAGRLSSLPQKVGSTRTLVHDADSTIKRTVLPGGLRVITEHMPGVRSASVGVWVGVGSRDETATLHGCTHFLEHLLFKGTRERSALDISASLDAVGGEFNAFTAKEYTCFHARVLDADLPLAVDVLGDMITNSLLTPDDVEAERNVILDEIAMHDDDPDDVVHNLFAGLAWGESSPLGQPIAGTMASIEAINRTSVARFYKRHYRAANMVVAAAGNLDHARWCARSAPRSPATGSWPVTRCPAPAPGWSQGPESTRPSVVSTVRSNRSTWSSAYPASTAPTTVGSRSGCSTPLSAAARRRGCSRRFAKLAGWPTPSSPSPSTTPIQDSWA